MRMRSLSIDSLSTGIQSLHLRNTGLDFNSVLALAASPTQKMRLQRLSCDPVSMYNYHVRAAKIDPSNRLDLSRVESLRIEFQYLSQEYIMKHLLNEATCLRELEFSDMADSALANLVALTTLEFNFSLPFHLNLQHPRHLHWDQLPTVIAKPGALPLLRRVAIHIVIRCRIFVTETRNNGYSKRGAVILPPTESSAAREQQAAGKLAEDLTEFVYMGQLVPSLTVRPGLDLSFTTQVLVSTSPAI
ncbi:hypothetical protein FA13DRAFT_1724295 [Coprinellus micaceus]|uniref:Uncharacterized protein n=1 Tax=Coprinellus micaceus TaxID=71717 RepID=A0A4Y7U0W4_COPMI|nr:hypothetical protein FA13DRAFT_1724295 [Coprinellus micaceus]